MVDPAIVLFGGFGFGGLFGAGIIASMKSMKLGKLDKVITELRRQSNFWEGQYRARSEQYDEVCKVNANLHDALRNANRLAGDRAIEITELEKKWAAANGRLETMARIADSQRKTLLSQGDEIGRLTKALAEASKNDKRDAKGRFTKAVSAEAYNGDWKNV